MATSHPGAVIALLAAATVGLAACGGNATAPRPGAQPETDVPTATESPPTGETAATVAGARFVQPEDGATVTNPVEVEMEATGITISPAAAGEEGAGHFHVMVDVGCVPSGQVIPEDDKHVHFGDGSTKGELDLEADPDHAPAGETHQHTLCLQVGTNDHVALDATDQITVSVR